jgi:hypothetical protein
MMPLDHIGTLEKATESSIGWLSSFPFKTIDLFMVLQVCADESYRLDDGQRIVAIGGWLASPEKMEKFCQPWAAVLKKYKVEHFHFKEFADRKHKYHKSTIYDHLDEINRENLLFELALVACEMGIPIGGCSAPKHQSDAKADTDGKLKEHGYAMLFISTMLALKTSHDINDDTVNFIFDQNNDPSWRLAIESAITKFKGKGAPFGPWTTYSDTQFTPLQAADLYVYAMRQNGERYYNKKHTTGQARMLDLILEKNRPDTDNHNFTQLEWSQLMRTVIRHYRQWKREYPKEQYYPLIHCPLLQPQ